MPMSPNSAIDSAALIKRVPAKRTIEASPDSPENFAMLVDVPDQIEANPRSTPTTRMKPEVLELHATEVSVDVSGGTAAPRTILEFARPDANTRDPEAMDSRPTEPDTRLRKANDIEPLWIMLDTNNTPAPAISMRQQSVPLRPAIHGKAIALPEKPDAPLKDQSQSPQIVAPGPAPVPSDRDIKQLSMVSPLTDLSIGQTAARRTESVAIRFNKTIANAESFRSTIVAAALPIAVLQQQPIVPFTIQSSEGQDQTSSRQDRPETIDKAATALLHNRPLEDSIETALLTAAETAALPPRPIFHQVVRALAESTAAPSTAAAPMLSRSTLDTRQLTIELKPEGLGRIVATLTKIAGQLHVRLQPDSEPVAQQLQSDMGSLGQALVAAGVAVSDISIAPAVITAPSTVNASTQDFTTGSGARGEEARPQGRGDSRGEFARHQRDASPDGKSADMVAKTDRFYVV